MRKSFQIFLLCIGFNINAQENAFLKEIFVESFETHGLAYAPSKIRDVGNRYNYFAHGVGLKLPFIGRSSYKNTYTVSSFTQPFFTLNSNNSFAEVNGVETIGPLNTITTGLGLMRYNGKRTVILASMNYSYFSEGLKLQNTPGQLTGIIMLRKRLSNDIKYTLGMVNNFLYGQRLFLPIAGFSAKFSDKINLSITLPIQSNLSYFPTKTSRIRLFYKPFGGIHFVNVRDTLLSKNKDYSIFRRQELRSGVAFNKQLNNRFFLELETGYAGRRFVAVTNQFFNSNETDKYFFHKVNGTPYIQVKLIVKLYKKDSDWSLLNELDYEDLSLIYRDIYEF